jgi:hypothetical protein
VLTIKVMCKNDALVQTSVMSYCFNRIAIHSGHLLTHRQTKNIYERIVRKNADLRNRGWRFVYLSSCSTDADFGMKDTFSTTCSLS